MSYRLTFQDIPEGVPNFKIVGQMYWLNHDNGVWFGYRWDLNQGLWIINVDTMKLKCVSERLVDRGLQTLHEDMPFGSSKGQWYCSGKRFTAQDMVTIKEKVEAAKKYVIDNNLFECNDVNFCVKGLNMNMMSRPTTIVDSLKYLREQVEHWDDLPKQADLLKDLKEKGHKELLAKVEGMGPKTYHNFLQFNVYGDMDEVFE